MIGLKDRPAWAEVDLEAIAQNLRELRRITRPQARIMAVVKANAYGHGAVPVSRIALENGASYLGVAIFNEALELREAGINAPILVLGNIPKEQVETAIKLDITQTVYSLPMATHIAETALRLGKKALIHIKLDTGMTRLGFFGSQAVSDIEQIAALKGIILEGIYTHFAVSDAADKGFTLQQFKVFKDRCALLEAKGIKIPLKHVANSAAVIDMPETHLDMVRLGIALYGLYPSREVDYDKVALKPALSLKCKIVHLKEVPQNTTVSYGRKYKTVRNTKIATLPIGYADGFSRLLSSKAFCLIKGQKAPIVGTICMDQCMAEVGHIKEVNLGDEVVLMGRQGEEEISAEDLAAELGTINYEIVCMISTRIPRFYP